jgi:hypothetical protein
LFVKSFQARKIVIFSCKGFVNLEGIIIHSQLTLACTLFFQGTGKAKFDVCIHQSQGLLGCLEGEPLTLPLEHLFSLCDMECDSLAFPWGYILITTIIIIII